MPPKRKGRQLPMSITVYRDVKIAPIETMVGTPLMETDEKTKEVRPANVMDLLKGILISVPRNQLDKFQTHGRRIAEAIEFAKENKADVLILQKEDHEWALAVEKMAEVFRLSTHVEAFQRAMADHGEEYPVEE